MSERIRSWILGLLAAGVIAWALNGGASLLSNVITEALSGTDYSVAAAGERARAAEPAVVGWLEPYLAKIDAGRVVPELADLSVVTFVEGVRSAALGKGTWTGCFYHQPSHTVYLDAGFLGVLDQLARPRPDLTKAYVLSLVLAESVDPGARGAALDALAGGLAARLGFVPPSEAGRGLALWRAAIRPGIGLSVRVHEHLPPGWKFPLPDGAAAFEERDASSRAEAFLRGVQQVSVK